MGNTNSRRKRQASWWSTTTSRLPRKQRYDLVGADSSLPPLSDPTHLIASTKNAENYVLSLNTDAGLHPNHTRADKKVQLDFAGYFESRLSMPDVLQALVCDYLNHAELRNLQHVSHGAHYFVQRRHRQLSRFRNPRHLGQLRTFEDLDVYQRLDLKLMRFYDRPVWQRCLIGVACVPIIPFVFLWHSPKVVKYVYFRAVEPMAMILHRRVLQPVWHAVNNWVIEPVVQSVLWSGRFIRDWIAIPFMQCVWQPGCDLVVRAAISVYQNILIPFRNCVQRTAQILYRTIALPCARAVQQAATSVSSCADSVCQYVWQHGVEPLSSLISELMKVVLRCVEWSVHMTHAYLLSPIANVVCSSWRHGMVPFGRWFVRCMYWCARQIHSLILSPVWHALVFICTRMMIPFVRCVWSWILWPMLRTLWSVIRFVSEDIIWKALSSLWQLARILLVDFLYTSLCVPLSRSAWKYVLAPIGELLLFTAQVLYDWMSVVVVTLSFGCSIVGSFIQTLAFAIAKVLGAES